MILLRVELWPSDRAEDHQIIAEAMIENRGRTSSGHRYRATLQDWGHLPLRTPSSQVLEVDGHDRSESVWNLIQQILSNATARHPSRLTNESPACEDRMPGLFLDILPAAWGLDEVQLEELLDLPVGWLRAWRNNEVTIDDALRLDISELGMIQEGLRRTRDPEAYPEFWHRHWPKHSPIGARSPWQAFKEDGFAVLDTIKRYLEENEVRKCLDIERKNRRRTMTCSEDIPEG